MGQLRGAERRKGDTWCGTISVAEQLFFERFLLPRLNPLVTGGSQLNMIASSTTRATCC
jgi:hypothetical protein